MNRSECAVSRSFGRVFVASTFGELGDHRLRVIDAIRRLDLDVGAVEVLAAGPGIPLDHCYELIDRSDALVVLSGLEAGSIPLDSQGGDGHRSFTWLEVAYAVENARIPVFAFISSSARTNAQYPARAFNHWLSERFLIDYFDDSESAVLGVVVALARHYMRPKAVRGTTEVPQGIVSVHEILRPPSLLGRDLELSQMDHWYRSPVGPNRSLQITGLGGCGKTALLGTWLDRASPYLKSASGITFVWSFSDRADPVAFFRSLSTALLREVRIDARDRFHAVVRALGAGADHLLVIDGIDRVLRGASEYSDVDTSLLQELFETIDDGLGNCRLLAISRHSLDRPLSGTRIRLGPLSDSASRSLLCSVQSGLEEVEIAACLAAAGNHPLSLRALGSLIRYFGAHDLDPELLYRVPHNDDRSASVLANVLAEYTRSLSRDERNLLAILSAFPKGLPTRRVERDSSSKQRFSTEVALIGSSRDASDLGVRLLRDGILEEYRFRDAMMLSAHAFFRNWFRPLYGCSDEEVKIALDRRLGKAPVETNLLADHGTDFLLGQLSLPAVDWIAPWTAWWFNLVNYEANIGAIESLGTLDNRRVLDLGFGGGLGLRVLLESSKSVSVDGVDASREMVRIACETFPEEVRSGRLRLQQCEVGVHRLAFPERTFDAVVSICTVPFWKDVSGTLRELRRVLRPGGVLRLVVESYRLEYLLSFPKRGFSTLSDHGVVALLASTGFTNVGARLVEGLGGNFTLLTCNAPGRGSH